MSGSHLVPLVFFAISATFSPGGATTLATASGARFGLRRSAPLLIGMASGLAALGAATGLGLAGLILAAPLAEQLLRFAGSGYLVWLAFCISRGGAPGKADMVAVPIGLLGGAALIQLNPKAWATVLGAAALFADSSDNTIALAITLASVLGLFGVASLTLWCVAGELLAQHLTTNRQWSIVNGILALLLLLAVAQMWF
ncbi:LysE family translocator [Billgrantia sp. Q4P2]|uniref:LysE family translocator n=1 Tax=Billgrantia sp. Q4P2 TaxID=3463857 RepID=UPI004056AE2F